MDFMDGPDTRSDAFTFDKSPEEEYDYGNVYK